MAHGLILVDDELVLLEVSRAARSAGIEKFLGERQPARVVGHAVEFDQAHLDNLVSGREPPFAIAKIVPEQFGIFQTHIEQRAFARRLEMRDARLVEMPRAVKFVAEFGVVVPALLPHPFVARRIRVHRAERVEVAVRLLRRRNPRDPAVELLLERRVRLHAEHIRRALDRLVGVGVVERVDRRRLDLEILLARRAPAHDLGREIEILQPARRLALLQRERHRDRPVDLLLRLPETAGDAHGGKRHGLIRVVGGGCRSRSELATESQRAIRHSGACAQSFGK